MKKYGNNIETVAEIIKTEQRFQINEQTTQ